MACHATSITPPANCPEGSRSAHSLIQFQFYLLSHLPPWWYSQTCLLEQRNEDTRMLLWSSWLKAPFGVLHSFLQDSRLGTTQKEEQNDEQISIWHKGSLTCYPTEVRNEASKESIRARTQWKRQVEWTGRERGRGHETGSVSCYKADRAVGGGEVWRNLGQKKKKAKSRADWRNTVLTTILLWLNFLFQKS